MSSSFNIDFVRTYIGGTPLTESPETRRDRSRTMPRPSTSAPSQTSQEFSANQFPPLGSLPEQDSRSRDPLPRDEPLKPAMTINFIRSYIGGLPEVPEGRLRTMQRPSTSPTSRASQDSPATQSSTLESLLAQDSRNKDPLPRDELHDTAATTNHDDHSHRHSDAYYTPHYNRCKSERDRYRDRCAELEEILKDKDHQLERLEQEARRREREVKRREKAVAAVMDEFKKLREQERIRSNELATAERQHEETKRVLKAKIEELEGVQVFTRKADSSRGSQAPSAPQSSSPESSTQQRSRNGNLWGGPSGAAETLRPDNNRHHQSEPPRPNHIKPEYIISSDKCAKPKKSPSSPPNRNHRPGWDPCDYEREMEKREREVEELRDEVKGLQENERRRVHELSVAEEQHEETKRLLQSKIDELDGMQAFTKSADQASVADVIDLVKALNASILEVAVSISDPQHLSSLTVAVSEQDIQQATEVVRTRLGEEMGNAVQTLRKSGKDLHPEDPTVVQITLQIAMTRLCGKIINAWTPHPDADKWLDVMYEKIRASEGQSVAGRWRALTRAQASGAKDPAAIVNHLIERLGWVLLAVGSKVPTERFRNNFQKHLASIADNVIRVQTAAGEFITSVDVMPYFYAPGTEFRMDDMDDMYGSRSMKEIRKGPILGTTGLGLWLMGKQANTITGQLKDENIPLLRAKILFASALQE